MTYLHAAGGLTKCADLASTFVRVSVLSMCASLLVPMVLPPRIDGGVMSDSIAHAQEITIGVPEISRTLNFLTPASHQPTTLEQLAASLIRDAVTRTLISLPSSPPSSSVPISASQVDGAGAAEQKRESGGSFSLELSDSVQISQDQREWRLRIRRDQTFSNGRPIRAEDISFSLERCIGHVRGRTGRQSGFSVEVLDRPRGGSQELQGSDSWVAVRDSGQGAFALRLTELLASCPVIERQSGELFADQLGVGSNVVGSGRFKIASVDPGREYHFEQVRFGTTKTKRIVVRALKDGTHALTALRSGTVDAIFFDSAEVLSKASSDQTLLISECSGYKFVHRRALRVECRGQITAQIPSPVHSVMAESGMLGSAIQGSAILESARQGSGANNSDPAAAASSRGGVLVGGGLFGRPPVFGPAPIDLATIHYVS